MWEKSLFQRVFIEILEIQVVCEAARERRSEERRKRTLKDRWAQKHRSWGGPRTALSVSLRYLS